MPRRARGCPARDRSGAAQQAQVKLGLRATAVLGVCQRRGCVAAAAGGARTQRPLVFSASTYHLRRSGHTLRGRARVTEPQPQRSGFIASPAARTRPSGSKPASPASVPSSHLGATVTGSLRARAWSAGSGREQTPARFCILYRKPPRRARAPSVRVRRAPQRAVSLGAHHRGGAGGGAGGGAAGHHRARHHGRARGQHAGGHSFGVRTSVGRDPPAAATRACLRGAATDTSVALREGRTW